MSVFLALGVAMAGLAVGVRFSPSPAPSAPAAGQREETGRRGDRGTGGHGDAQTRRRGETTAVEASRAPEKVSSDPDSPRLRVSVSSRPEAPRHRAAASPGHPLTPSPPPPETEGESAPAPIPELKLPAEGSGGALPLPGTVPEPPPTDELSPRVTPKPRPAAVLPAAVSALEIARGPAGAKRIALTFDAGSSAQPTPAILAALRKQGLRCTFFLTGRWTEHNPEIVRRIAAEGHELANHTYTHPDLTRLPDAQVLAELQRTEDAVRRVTGRSTKPYFRPPFGARDARVLRLAAADGYRCIYWTTDSWDSVKKGIRPAEIRRRVLGQASPGDIVLMHCGSQATADALPGILDALKEQGYDVVTVSELLDER